MTALLIILRAMRTRIPQRFARLAAIAGLAFIPGCLDGPTAVKLVDIVGAWELVHLNRTSANTGEVIDAMAVDSGSSLVMTIATDGTLTTVAISSGGAPVNGTGTIAVSGGKTKLVLDGQAYYGNIFMKDGQLTVDCGEQLGLEEFSRITFVFARQ